MEALNEQVKDLKEKLKKAEKKKKSRSSSSSSDKSDKKKKKKSKSKDKKSKDKKSKDKRKESPDSLVTSSLVSMQDKVPPKLEVKFEDLMRTSYSESRQILIRKLVQEWNLNEVKIDSFFKFIKTIEKGDDLESSMQKVP